MINRDIKLQRYILDKADINKIPISGTFELSPMCNMKCKMCYIVMNQAEVDDKGGLKSYDEWIRLAHEAKENGTLYLLLTGGEVFLYKNFKELYLELAKMGFFISINSNATMINDDVIEWLAEFPPRVINVTMYGSSDETYARLCNNPKGFTQVKRGIDLLIKNNINVRINASVTPENKDDLFEIYRFAKERSLEFNFSAYMFPPMRKGSDASNEEHRFSAKDVAKYTLSIEELKMGKEDFLGSCDKFLNTLEESINENNDEGLRCRAGNSSYWITWDGKMTPCGMMYSPCEYPFKYGFKNSWENIKTKVSNITLSKKCNSCEKRSVCKICAASALTETGSFDKTPQYICDVTDSMIDNVSEILKDL